MSDQQQGIIKHVYLIQTSPKTDKFHEIQSTVTISKLALVTVKIMLVRPILVDISYSQDLRVGLT